MALARGVGGVPGGFWAFGATGLLHWLGYAVLILGVVLMVTGQQWARFRGGQGGPGAAHADEGQVADIGPVTGGAVALGHLRLTLQIRFDLIRAFGLVAVRGVRVMKVEKYSIVLRGWLYGEQVIFKKYLRPKAADIVNRAAVELRFLEANLSKPFYANRCIATKPGIGVIVLAWVPGLSIGQALSAAPEPRRKEVLQLAGGWLEHCADLRSQDKPLRPQQYTKQVHGLDMRSLDPRDQILIAGVLGELRCLAARLKGMQATHAIAHDDLSLANLYYHADEIHAIDINGANWIPVMRMAARFLVMKDLYLPLSESGLFHGLDADDADLFLDAIGVAVKKRCFARFFIGEQMVRIYLRKSVPSDRRAHARNRINAFLSDSEASKAAGDG